MINESITSMIQRLCPDGVEYRPIKDIYTRLKGTPITASRMKEIADDSGDIIVVAGGKNIIRAKRSDLPHGNIIEVPSVLVQSRGIIDVVYSEEPFTFKNEMWAYTSDDRDSVKYLYYIMKKNIQTFRDAASGMGSLPQISLKVTEDYIIPYPPIEIQREIVRILDTFTSLTAELSLRKKQYEFYLDKLLSFDHLILEEGERERERTRVRWIELGKLFNLKNGYTPSKNNPHYWNGIIPWFRMEDLRLNGSILSDSILKISEDAIKNVPFPENSIIVATSATIGEHALITVPFTCNQRFTCMILKNEYKELYNPLFLYYYTFILDKWCISNTKQSSFPSVDMKRFKQFKYPLIPLDEQNRIVSRLDAFHHLCNNLCTGIPAEIEARKKQYEYYLNKLLSFDEVSS